MPAPAQWLLRKTPNRASSPSRCGVVLTAVTPYSHYGGRRLLIILKMPCFTKGCRVRRGFFKALNTIARHR